MFLHVFLFFPQGDLHGRGQAWQGNVWHGACMAGVMHDRGCALWGACATGETTTAVGSMHPTGMHSC